ncbi:MAG: HEAT repeat domain-containing protein [Armatimonadota bacterium]|nr:HEAT repeat domain-containing protein [bacterium]
MRHIDYLVRCLSNPRLDRVLRARTRLVSMGHPAVDALIAAADSSLTEVRVEIAIALGYIRDKKGYDALVKLTYDPADFVRYEAAWALGNMADERAKTRLAEMAEGSDPSSASAASALEVFTSKSESEVDIVDDEPSKAHKVRLIVSEKAFRDRLAARNRRRSFRKNRH